MKPSPVLDPFKQIILNWLEEDKSAPRKQVHTARRIYDRLVDEYGFTGGESTVRRYVRVFATRPNQHSYWQSVENTLLCKVARPQTQRTTGRRPLKPPKIILYLEFR